MVAYRLAALALFTYGVTAQDTVKCGNFDSVTAPGNGYYIQNDAWNATTDGSSCISVSPNVDSFNATWKWPTGKDNTHSFPHINFQPKNLPAPLSNITAMVLAADWTVDSTTWIGNVALDMFADSNAANAVNSTLALYELMVWFGDFGGPWPLGYADGIKATETVNNVDYHLYVGTTRRGSTTLSWLAASTVQTVNMDIVPLFKAMAPFMASDLTLGLVQFGSECFFSADNVTFGVSNFSLSFTSQTTSGNPSSTTISPTSTKKSNSNFLTPNTGVVSFLIVFGSVMMYVM